MAWLVAGRGRACGGRGKHRLSGQVGGGLLVGEPHHVLGRALQVPDLLGVGIGSGNGRSSVLGSCGNLGRLALARLRTDGVNDGL